MVTGPTASGKSALAVELAKKLDTDIISADSRQIYTSIPITTAIPTEEEKEGVIHHLMDILPLDAYYSAARFQEDANPILERLFQKKETAIVCGGSMLYIDALLNGIDELPTINKDFRLALMNEWKEKGNEWLLEKLKILDPAYYLKVDLKNLKRVFHAVEISLTAKVPYTSLLTRRHKTLSEDLPFNVLKICLNGPRDLLFEKINNRVIRMMNQGLEEEAQRVYPLRHLNSLNTVGLKEMFDMFDGKLTRSEAVARIQKNTRVYAKKQLTWHKNDNILSYLDFTDTNNYNVEKIINLLNQKS